MKTLFKALALIALSACMSISNVSSSVPFDLTTGRPVVQVTLKDGSQAPFVFDTGAMGASVGQGLASSLQMPVIGQAMVSSPHGGTAIDANIVDAGYFELAGVRATKADAVSSEALDAFLPGGAANVIGPANFKRSVVEIDFRTNTIRIGARPLQEPKIWLPIDETGLLRGRAKVNGTDVPFTLDIGNPGGAVTSLSLAKTWNPDAAWQQVGRMGPIGAARPLSLGALNSKVDIAGVTLQLGVVGALDGGPDYLNLGSEFVKGLTIVIDNPKGRWGLAGTPFGPVNMPPPQKRPA